MAIRSKEQEIRDFVKIYLKAGDSRSEVARKLKNSYKNDADVLLGLKFYDEMAKELGLKGALRDERRGYTVAVTALIISLALFSSAVFYLFFYQATYSKNLCGNERVSIEVKGPPAFRAFMGERIDLIMERDCDSFKVLAENIESIEYSEAVLGRFDLEKRAVITGSTGSSDYWYTVFLVKGACMFEGIHSESSKSADEIELECFEAAARAVESVHENKTVAEYLRQKKPSVDWKEFRLYS